MVILTVMKVFSNYSVVKTSDRLRKKNFIQSSYWKIKFVLGSEIHCSRSFQIILQSDFGISEFHSFFVDNLAPSLPISSEHFAPYPFPPATKVTPSDKVSM